jgi:hypothetical protein
MHRRPVSLHRTVDLRLVDERCLLGSEVTFSLRSLHVVHPFLDFLWVLRVGGSESGGTMTLNMTPPTQNFEKCSIIQVNEESIDHGGD